MKSWVTDVVKFVNQENFTEKEAMDYIIHISPGTIKLRPLIDMLVVSFINLVSLKNLIMKLIWMSY